MHRFHRIRLVKGFKEMVISVLTSSPARAVEAATLRYQGDGWLVVACDRELIANDIVQEELCDAVA